MISDGCSKKRRKINLGNSAIGSHSLRRDPMADGNREKLLGT